MLTLYPAIDLKNGVCVRLFKGAMDAATSYNENPADQATAFSMAGFDWLHIVDLDGAFAGHTVNGTAVEKIRKASNAKMQIGGGIRSMADIEHWLDLGMTRVILGTVAARNPDFVRLAARHYPGQIAVGIDARKGQVATEGWAESSGHTARDLALRYEDSGVAAIIYTDIDRDGALGGVNLEETNALAEAVSIPLIASGGVSCLNDLKAIKKSGMIEGVIIGRALYEQKISAEDALTLAS